MIILVQMNNQFILSSYKAFTTAIISLATQFSRIIVGDMQESIQFAVYKVTREPAVDFCRLFSTALGDCDDDARL